MTLVPDISVIIPVKNGMPFLYESINSILQQTYNDFELIIVDDHSEDGTAEYVCSIEDERVKYYSLDNTSGIVSALNYGLDKANASYIARMDADDIAHPERLSRQFSFLENNPDCVLVGSKISVLSEDSLSAEALSYERWYNQSIDDESIIEQMYMGNCINHPSVMFRIDGAAKCGMYRDRYPGSEDYDLFIRLRRYGKFRKLNDKLLTYRIHERQVSFRMQTQQRINDAKLKAKMLLANRLEFNRKLALFGVGTGGLLMIEALNQRGIKIDYLFDNNQSKWGTCLNGVPVVGGMEHIVNYSDCYFVLASSPARHEVTAKLERIGLISGRDFQAVW